MSFAQALGKSFVEHKDQIRIRSFELGGHTFNVKVPLTMELEAIQKRLKQPDEDTVNKYFEEYSTPFLESKEESEKIGVEFYEKDVVVSGRSLMETAKNKALTELRITEMFKLLIPEDKSFDMESITYAMIEELFPFAVQLEIMETIGKTISPEYSSQRKKS